MRLSDIIGHLDLAAWPQMALVVFLAVFFAVSWREWRRPKAEHDHAAAIPFDEE